MDDERCPCAACLVGPVCTDYCTRFHHYRKLILAEVNFFISRCIYEYLPDEDNSTRLMSQIERDLTTAGNMAPYLQEDYIIVKNSLSFLDKRFTEIIENSRSTNRGVDKRG